MSIIEFFRIIPAYMSQICLYTMADITVITSIVMILYFFEIYGYYKSLAPDLLYAVVNICIVATLLSAPIYIVTTSDWIKKIIYAIYAIGAITILMALPYVCQLPIRLDSVEYGGGKRFILAQENPSSEAGLAIYMQDGYRYNTWWRQLYRRLQSVKENKFSRMILYRSERGQFILIENNGLIVDCMRVDNGEAVTCTDPPRTITLDEVIRYLDKQIY